MARRKTTKKPRVMKKQKGYKKKVYKRRPVFDASTHLPLGQSQLVRHRYLENTQVSTNLGIANVYAFQLNSLFDPNYSGVGHQPIGFDQMSAVFNTYTVLGARVNLKCWNRSSNFLGFGIYFTETPNSPLSTLSVQGLLEQGAMKWLILPPVSQSQGPRTLTAKISMKKFFRIKNMLDDDITSSNIGTNPARGCFMHVITWQPDGELTSAQGSFYLTLDQIALYRKPANLAQS